MESVNKQSVNLANKLNATFLKLIIILILQTVIIPIYVCNSKHFFFGMERWPELQMKIYNNK